MPLCCPELKFSYLRTCKSHSIVNTCWHKFHVRSHLVYAWQVIILHAAIDFLYQEAKAQNRPIKSASRSRYLPTRYNPQVQLIHNQGYGDYLHFNERSAIDEPIWNSQRFDVRLLTREIRCKKHLATHAHIQTHTYTMWMRTVSCVASIVLYQSNGVSKL